MWNRSVRVPSAYRNAIEEAHTVVVVVVIQTRRQHQTRKLPEHLVALRELVLLQERADDEP